MGKLKDPFSKPFPGTFIFCLAKNKSAFQVFRQWLFNIADQQQQPGMGPSSSYYAVASRERMRGQFAGYIPANRAEKFREAATMMSEAPGV